MNREYSVGGHRFGVTGEALVETLDRMKWFKPYVFTPEAAEIASVDLPEFGFAEGKACEVPTFTQEQYAFLYEEVDSVFGTTVDGYLLRLTPEGKPPCRCGSPANDLIGWPICMEIPPYDCCGSPFGSAMDF